MRAEAMKARLHNDAVSLNTKLKIERLKRITKRLIESLEMMKEKL